MEDVLNTLPGRLIVLVLLACGVVVVPAAPALADCPAQESSSLDQQAKAADAVFTGTVTDRRLDGDRRVYTLTVDRVYKGDVAAETTVSTPRRSAQCGLRLDDADYVFFATSVGGELSADSRGGTAPATEARVHRVERLLGSGEPAVRPEPEEATLTLVAGEPTTLGRLAAPGAALVIVGLLGLLLVAGLGRRRA
jgi:hypothetical protein